MYASPAIVGVDGAPVIPWHSGQVPIGLSQVHISPGDSCLVGASRIAPNFPLMPVNGWGPPEGMPESRPLAQAQGDAMVTYRRGLSVVSVGRFMVRVPTSKRGAVTRLTGMSKSRLVRALEDSLAPYRYMATLTVGADWSRDGRVFKDALDRWLRWFLKEQRAATECPGEDSIFWFLEFQARGAPHVHCFYTSRVPWQDAAAYWARCIGDPRVERTGTKFETIRTQDRGGRRARMCAYARKYAGKLDQKVVPADYTSVGRFWGIRGCRIMCTCRVQAAQVEMGGGRLLARITEVLDAARDQGLVRYVRWLEGDGGCYFTRGSASLYDIHLWDGRQLTSSVGYMLDMIVMGYLAGATGGESFAGVRGGR